MSRVILNTKYHVIKQQGILTKEQHTTNERLHDPNMTSLSLITPAKTPLSKKEHSRL